MSSMVDSAKEIQGLATEALSNPAEFLKNPEALKGILPSNIKPSLAAMQQEVTDKIQKLPTFTAELQAGIKQIGSRDKSHSENIGESFSISDGEGNKINFEQAVEGIAMILGAFAKLFGKESADANAEDEFDIDTNPTSLDEAMWSGDNGRIQQEAKQYFENHPEGGGAGYGLLGAPAKVTYENGKKMTWCAQSARLFAEKFFGAKIPTVENAYQAERQLYNAGQKLTPEGALKWQQSKPGTIFHVFFDRPKDKGLSEPLGHAAIAYVDKWGQLRVYDPYIAPTGSASKNARNEAYLLAQHQRISSARLYPVSYNTAVINPNVAQLVNTDNKITTPPTTSKEVLTLKKTGDFEKLPDISKDEIEEISRMTQAEAGAKNLEGQLRVAGVILNRLMNKDFPKTVSGVLEQKLGPKSSKHQFSPMDDGRIQTFQPNQEVVNAIISMITSGTNPAKHALYFQAHSIGENNWMGKSRSIVLREGAGGHNFYA